MDFKIFSFSLSCILSRTYVYAYVYAQGNRLQKYKKNPIYANIYGKIFQKC